jgi:hypothetical protein
MNEFSVNIQSMKNKLLMIIGVLAIAGTSANAGWFGAGLKPVPYLKVPFVKLVVPVPSAVVGPRAGTEVDANVSTSGANVALPWVKGGVRWPSLTLGEGKATVTIGPKHRPSKKAVAKKKVAAKKGKRERKSAK